MLTTENPREKAAWILVSALFFTGIGGCAYGVSTRTDVAPGVEEPAFKKGAVFSVVTNDGAEDVVFDRKVGTKIQTLLEEKGFFYSGDHPDYYVEYDYGVTGKTKKRVVADIRHPSNYRYYVRGAYYQSYFADPLFHSRHEPETYPAYRFELRITVSKSDPQTVDDRDDTVVWSGEAYVDSDEKDLGDKIDYLLVALFKRFGEETSDTTGFRVELDDPLLQTLRTKQW